MPATRAIWSSTALIWGDSPMIVWRCPLRLAQQHVLLLQHPVPVQEIQRGADFLKQGVNAIRQLAFSNHESFAPACNSCCGNIHIAFFRHSNQRKVASSTSNRFDQFCTCQAAIPQLIIDHHTIPWQATSQSPFHLLIENDRSTSQLWLQTLRKAFSRLCRSSLGVSRIKNRRDLASPSFLKLIKSHRYRPVKQKCETFHYIIITFSHVFKPLIYPPNQT